MFSSLVNATQKIGLLTIALTIALGVSYALAQTTWQEPSSPPPADNVAAPINVSTNAQTKPAMLTTAISRAAQEVRSVRYCDYDGNNCFDADDIADLVAASSEGGGGGGGGGGNFLVNEVHTRDECTAAGGTVEVEGAEAICRFPGASCPADWTQYQNWGSVTPKACTTNNTCSNTSCSVGTGWDNSPDSCVYTSGDGRAGDGCRFDGSSNVCQSSYFEVGCY